MIKNLTTSVTTDDMCETLSEDGVFKIENYLNQDNLDILHNEVRSLCETEAGHYEFGRNYRGGSLSEYSPESAISKTYEAKWMKDLHYAYTGNPNRYGINVFATHDYKYEGELARNGWLHFDRLWRLKFFIYLTDIDSSSGAFTCSVGSRAKGAELRKAAWNTPDYEGVKNRIDLDYPDLAKSYPAEPVEASAGTLIVFDTDTFHKGGKCDEGKERLVVRLHCE